MKPRTRHFFISSKLLKTVSSSFSLVMLTVKNVAQSCSVSQTVACKVAGNIWHISLVFSLTAIRSAALTMLWYVVSPHLPYTVTFATKVGFPNRASLSFHSRFVEYRFNHVTYFKFFTYEAKRSCTLFLNETPLNRFFGGRWNFLE